MNDIIEIITFVATAVWHVWLYFLISIFLAVLINNLNLSSAIRRAFDNRIGIAILAATAVGAFSPFCSCTVIPVIAGLLASGVPLAPIMSFWIASPTMDPEIFALTAGVLGMPLAIVRLGATLLLSLGAGFLTWALLKIPRFAPRTFIGGNGRFQPSAHPINKQHRHPTQHGSSRRLLCCHTICR